MLLDTQVVLWQVLRTRDVGPQTADRLSTADEIAFSVVSFAEIGIKVAIGKLRVPDDLQQRIVADGIRILGLRAEHGLALARLPLHHRDPFDRLLVAQAMDEGLTLVTADPQLARYDVPVLDPLS